MKIYNDIMRCINVNISLLHIYMINLTFNNINVTHQYHEIHVKLEFKFKCKKNSDCHEKFKNLLKILKECMNMNIH